MPVAETKEFKTSYELNPVIAQQLNAFLAFGRTKQPACGGSVAAVNVESSGSASSSSSSSSTSSSSSSSSSSTSSVSSTSSSSSETGQTGSSSGSSPISSSGSNSGASSGSSSASVSSSTSIGSSSSSSFSSPDDSHLPTNEQFYPISVSETQTNDDIHNSQQYYDEPQESGNLFNKFGQKHKKTWEQILHAPGHAMQKVRKFGADLIGLGPLYGSDHFAEKFTHRKLKM